MTDEELQEMIDEADRDGNKIIFFLFFHQCNASCKLLNDQYPNYQIDAFDHGI
jgi:hypothetical protein